MRPFDLVVDGLADVVEQAAELGDLHVGAELGGDDAGESSDVSLTCLSTFWPNEVR